MATDHISQNAAITTQDRWCLGCPVDRRLCYKCAVTASKQQLLKTPTANDKPAIKGKWLPFEFGDYHWHKCSACGVADKYIETVKREGYPDVDMESVRNFCPNCGTPMS